MEDLGLALPQGLAGVCWDTERSSCPDTTAAESRLLKTCLLNPRSSGHLCPSSRRLQTSGGCRLTCCPSSSLLAPRVMEKVVRWLGGPGTAVPAGSLWLGKKSGFAHLLHPSAQQRRGPAGDAVSGCYALLSAQKPKHAHRPSLKRHRCDGDILTSLLLCSQGTSAAGRPAKHWLYIQLSAWGQGCLST